MKFKAITDYEFKQIRQPISGFAMGYERTQVWRVQSSIGTIKLTTQKTYPSEASAKQAAKRLQQSFDHSASETK